MTGVVDAAGNAARYEYDAAGNIKRIDRFASTAIAIFGFSPAQGPAGTRVTISGKGFSTVASQNAVRFNGVASGVISASTDRLVVTVPVSATSGTISVTAPSGTAGSLDPFVVSAASSAPAIAGFAPAYGGVGDQFSVSGTRFSTVIPDNQLTVGGSPAGIVAATSTSLSALVGASTRSGPLRLTTPGGSAVSQGSFTVLGNGYRTADVGLLQLGSIGTAWTFNAADASKVYVLVFAGQAGQRISIAITNQTASSATTRIYSPSGSSVGDSFSSASGNAYSSSMTLPVAGEYQLVFDPAGVGSATIRVIADAVGTLVTNGDPATQTTTMPGQNAAFSFSGTAGQ
ncbi:MAG: peptidase, partial [Xanthomonadaceae bacterium]|nr:peptidase [Xanthomonadaceae bacterium]